MTRFREDASERICTGKGRHLRDCWPDLVGRGRARAATARSPPAIDLSSPSSTSPPLYLPWSRKSHLSFLSLPSPHACAFYTAGASLSAFCFSSFCFPSWLTLLQFDAEGSPKTATGGGNGVFEEKNKTKALFPLAICGVTPSSREPLGIKTCAVWVG